MGQLGCTAELLFPLPHGSSSEHHRAVPLALAAARSFRTVGEPPAAPRGGTANSSVRVEAYEASAGAPPSRPPTARRVMAKRLVNAISTQNSANWSWFMSPDVEKRTKHI